MNDDPDRLPERLRAWRHAFHDPAVERVDLVGDGVRVRLQSGVELEWPLDEPESESDSDSRPFEDRP
ncbi:hypothetical protein [Leifsonia sp. 2MCAF36]|uniref:hypothetical protein n=1 Tax=Leifsonia sp. 2MCAF36 TaxID=3232988 RepID=UPI003F9CE3DE